MNLLMIHRDLPPDTFTGVALQVHRLANALVKQGNTVTVLTFSGKPTDARYRVLTLKRPWYLRWFPAFKRLLVPLAFSRFNFDSYDAVHVHGDGAFLPYEKKFVRTFYGTARLEMKHSRGVRGKMAQALSYFFEWRENRKAGNWEHVYSISSHLKQYLPHMNGVIPCALPEGWRGEYLPVKTDPPQILFLGSANSRKRGDWAIRLHRDLRQVIPDLTTHYVGAARAETGNVPGMRFYQRIPAGDLMNLYMKSWIYLNLSSYEGFGVPFVEAMAAGCLVACTETPGSREVVLAKEMGILLDEENANRLLAQALRNFADTLDLRKRAYEYSLHFTPDVVAARYGEILREATA